MHNFLGKVKKSPWVVGQTLTKKPRKPQSAISDLFIWRYNKSWNTYFELLDLTGLFGEKGQHQADIIFFNNNGEQFHQKSIENRWILNEKDYPKLRTGHGSVLTKYEPVASRVDPVYNHFCLYGGTLFSKIM